MSAREATMGREFDLNLASALRSMTTGVLY